MCACESRNRRRASRGAHGLFARAFRRPLGLSLRWRSTCSAITPRPTKENFRLRARRSCKGQHGNRSLVTGGAGFIGTIPARRSIRRVFAFDDLSKGYAEFVRWRPLVQGDILDAAALDAAFAQHRPSAVVHFAALAYVGGSILLAYSGGRISSTNRSFAGSKGLTNLTPCNSKPSWKSSLSR